MIYNCNRCIHKIQIQSDATKTPLFKLHRFCLFKNEEFSLEIRSQKYLILDKNYDLFLHKFTVTISVGLVVRKSTS